MRLFVVMLALTVRGINTGHGLWVTRKNDQKSGS